MFPREASYKTKFNLVGKKPPCWEKLKAEGEKATEDEMVGWHHQFNVHELGQTLGDAEGQGSLVCCSPWGWEESDVTEQLNDNKESTCQCRRHNRLRFNRWVRRSLRVGNGNPLQ